MAQRGGERACVSTAAVNGITDARELASAVHEFGHLLGAEDHNGSGGYKSTYQKNGNSSTGPYNMNCIYGENKGAPEVYENITICDGCLNAMK